LYKAWIRTPLQPLKNIEIIQVMKININNRMIFFEIKKNKTIFEEKVQMSSSGAAAILENLKKVFDYDVVREEPLRSILALHVTHLL
jgi:hypothetical protein